MKLVKWPRARRFRVRTMEGRRFDPFSLCLAEIAYLEERRSEVPEVSGQLRVFASSRLS